MGEEELKQKFALADHGWCHLCGARENHRKASIGIRALGVEGYTLIGCKGEPEERNLRRQARISH
jgi:hypothetical protein